MGILSVVIWKKETDNWNVSTKSRYETGTIHILLLFLPLPLAMHH